MRPHHPNPDHTDPLQYSMIPALYRIVPDFVPSHTATSLARRILPTTSSFAVGDDVPIPIFPVERVVSCPSIAVPKRRFPILRVFELVGVGVSILYPRMILLDPHVSDSPANAPMAILL